MTAFKIRLGIQSDTEALSKPTAATFSLIGACLRNAFDRESLYFALDTVATDSR